MTPMASVFTPSFNKGAYAADAIRCILAQDYPDFEYWILENSTDDTTRAEIAPLLGDPRVIYQEFDIHPDWREKVYVPAWLLNQWYPRANGRYIFYLSDDDLLDPRTIGTCVRFLEADPARDVCWFSMRRVSAPHPGPGPYPEYEGGFPADKPMGHGTDFHHVDCNIDGGQVTHRKTCLDALPQPWFPEDTDGGLASHADGLFLQKLAARHTFWPVAEDFLTKRRTPTSKWNQCA